MIDVIIDKSLWSNRYGLRISGHAPNRKFESQITGIEIDLNDYKSAYWLAHTVQATLKLTGNITRIVNAKNAQADGDAFCDHMAFERVRPQDE